MAVGLTENFATYPVDGVRLGSTKAGIRYQGKLDLTLVELCGGATTAAVFTQNRFCAAPVTVAKSHMNSSMPRFLVINTGYANAGMGEQGMAASLEVCQRVAKLVGCNQQEVLPFSTGVIGEPLPVGPISEGLLDAEASLSEEGWQQAATAIMTTDTVPKTASQQVEIKGKIITVTGMSKGSGMIRPNMATMLAYVATDAAVSAELLQALLSEVTAESFNQISVDGDTSTNDALLLMATGKSELEIIIHRSDPAYAVLKKAITEVCVNLAQAIVRDGEGATKFITIEVVGGENNQDCRVVAETIAHSPLVKTACFASDPNWGRILAAVGRAEIKTLDIASVSISLDNVNVIKRGVVDDQYNEAAGASIVSKEEFSIKVSLGEGKATATLWTCDFSYDYVKINAEYRS